MKNAKTSIILSAALLGGFCASANIAADELDSQNPTATSTFSADSEISESVKLNRSVVTATGFKQDIKDAPASISIITGEEVVERPMRDLGEVVQNVPGVDVTMTKTGDSTISMRGLGSNYTLILIDGKRQNVNTGFHANGFDGFQSGMMPPPSMIERIEVLRGPASVVWGSEAMGGVINVITKKHPSKLTASVMIEGGLQEHNSKWQSDKNVQKYGSWGNMWGINGSIAAPLVKDLLSISLRGQYKDNGANEIFAPLSFRNIGQPNYNPYSSHSPSAWTYRNVGARLTFTPDSKNTFYIDADFGERDTGTLLTSGNRISAYNTFRKGNYVLSHDFNSDTLDTSTYFQIMDTQRIPHQRDNASGVNGDSGILQYSQSRQNRNYIFDSKVHKGVDLADFGYLDINGGIYYMHETYENKGDTRGVLKQNQYAAYVEGNWAINEMWSTDLGARYNYSDIYTGKINPRAYVNFAPFKWWMLKAGITSGMIVPQITFLGDGFLYNSGTAGYYGNPKLEAEKSWNYEVSSIFDTDFGLISISGFYSDFRDKVTTLSYVQDDLMANGTTCDYGSCTYYTNVGKSEVYGVETSYDLQLNKLGFNINYTFADSKQLDGANKGFPVNVVARHSLNSKLSYKFTPKLNAYVRLQYKAHKPITNSAPSVAGYSGQTRSAIDLYGTYYKPYSVVDLAVNYKIAKNVTFTAMLNNIFDTNFAYLEVSGQNYANRYGVYQPGRNLWASVKMDF